MEIYQSIFEHAPDAVLVVDGDGRLFRVNAQAERMFAHTREALLGQPVEILIPQRFADQHVAHRSKYCAEPQRRTMGAGLQLYGQRKDGTEFPVELTLSLLKSEYGAFVIAVVRDVTERKEAERVLESLREKDVLLKEIHHRVKNNLAVISSLFYLQSTYTQDAPTLRILQESQDRLRSVALVHETLYQSESSAALDFAKYAQVLSEHLFTTYHSATGNIRLKTDLETVILSVNLAVPCGLILNELLSNAFKHAFRDGSPGTITVSLHPGTDGSCVLQVADDGTGIPSSLDVTASKTLGLRLIQALTRQLDGTFDLVSKNPGTEARLTFKGQNDHH